MASLSETAERLAEILAGGTGQLSDPTGSDLEFLPAQEPQLLEALPAPERCWAVDGGQALVADARSFQVVATRAARTLWEQGYCTFEEQAELRSHLLVGAGGGAEGRQALAAMRAPVAPQAPVDINLLRDWSEWQLVERCVDEEQVEGTVVLVDGDLQPDWRVPASWLGELLDKAADKGTHLVGVTKHSSLARGGAPLVGQLELEAEAKLGRRCRWWAPVALRRPEVGPGLVVVVARLDPDARFDLPTGPDPSMVLGRLCRLSDDAAFPGYPYPLSVADRLAACSGWDRRELWSELDEALTRAGVAPDVKERAFADRHNFMERA